MCRHTSKPICPDLHVAVQKRLYPCHRQQVPPLFAAHERRYVATQAGRVAHRVFWRLHRAMHNASHCNGSSCSIVRSALRGKWHVNTACGCSRVERATDSSFIHNSSQAEAAVGARQRYTGKKTPGGAGTHTGHSRDTHGTHGTHGRTRAHGSHGRTSQPSIQTQRHTRTTTRRPKPRPTQQPQEQPQARSRPLPAADSEEAAPSEPDPAVPVSRGVKVTGERSVGTPIAVRAARMREFEQRRTAYARYEDRL